MTSDDEKNEKEIRKWLDKPETLSSLKKLSRFLGNYFSSHKIPLPGESSLDKYTKEDLYQHIESELCIYLIENRRNIQKRLMAPGISKEKTLKNEFIKYCRDKHRNKDIFKSFYKHAADTLRATDLFFSDTKSDNERELKYTAFSMKASSRKIHPIERATLCQIAFPQHICRINYKAVNKGKAILELAAYFWERICGIYGMPVKINLKDFVSWIQMSVFFPDIRNEDSIDKETEENGKGSKIIIEDEPHNFEPNLQKWAKNFAATLADRDKLIFFLRYHEDLDLKSIAAQSGFKGAPGPKGRLNIIDEKLKSFLRPLPRLSPEPGDELPLNEMDFELFMEILLKNLKKAIETP